MTRETARVVSEDIRRMLGYARRFGPGCGHRSGYHPQRADRQGVRPCRAENHQGDGPVRSRERECQVGQGDACFFGHGPQLLNGVEFSLAAGLTEVELRGNCLPERGELDRLAVAESAGQPAAVERAPGQHSEPVLAINGQLSGFATTDEHRVRRLLSPERDMMVPVRSGAPGAARPGL